MENDLFNLTQCMQTLDFFCQAQYLQSFGIHVTVAPYSYHTPAIKRLASYDKYLILYSQSLLCSHIHRTSDQQHVPMMFEESSKESLKYLDLMMYPASVTSSMPASYPFLDPDPDDYGDSPGTV